MLRKQWVGEQCRCGYISGQVIKMENPAGVAVFDLMRNKLLLLYASDSDIFVFLPYTKNMPKDQTNRNRRFVNEHNKTLLHTKKPHLKRKLFLDAVLNSL